jgi:heterodisulfide reductase subunit B
VDRLNIAWQDHAARVPPDDYLFTPSCILGALNPTTEVLATKLFDLLGLTWGMSGGPDAQCTCCSGILSHGDVITPESTLLVVARIWSVAAQLGFKNISTACVTSFGIHCECLELHATEPGLSEKVDRWLKQACGRQLQLPERVVHASDVVHRYRAELGAKLRYRLVDHRTGSPLRVVEHVGCHYNKLFPARSPGGVENCNVLAAPIRAWGGEVVDYPERRHCCGMGFRQCMIQPNRGYSMACVLTKLRSMEPAEPALILTNCPGCTQMLDREQWAASRLSGRTYAIPTLSYAELAGLLLGWDPYNVVGIQTHSVPVEPLLEQIGIDYDASRAYLTPQPVRSGSGLRAGAAAGPGSY